MFRKNKKSLQVVLEYTNSILYKSTIGELKKNFNIVNWNKNRPSDPVRLLEIEQYYSKKNEHSTCGVVHAWKNKENLEIFDGYNRFSALAKYDMMNILVQIYENIDESIIEEEFKTINKSISVPVLYFEQDNFFKRKVCESVAMGICKQFPTHVSPSRNCQKQNFNRDNLIDLVSTLEIDFTIKQLDYKILQEWDAINFIGKDFVTRNNIPTFQKNKYSNCYWVFLKPETIKAKIEESINRHYI